MSDEPKRALRQFLYNPLRQDPQELERLFVARRPLFERLYAEISSHQPNAVPQHQLIIGLRGMGKTTLLARLALELRKEQPGFLPLSFWEEQHIEVDRLSVFWLNCLDSLADALDVKGETEFARKLDGRIKEIQEISGEDDCARVAREAFGEAIANSGRRLVLFIDNFNLLLARLKRHDHVLRSFFTRHGAPIIIGAAITPPADMADYDAAFYDGFKTTLLHRLSLDETKDMILRLAEEYNQPAAIQNLWRELPRLAALRDLSGGNPRTSLLIYRLCAQGFSEDIYRDLETLLDETTALFQSRFEQLSEQGQKLVARLARQWKPMTAEAITEITGFPRSGVSPLLGRLEEEGIVEKVQLYDPERRDSPKAKRGGLNKRVGYQLTERFFNIWIIMRSASRRERAGIMCLSRFLESIYSPDERAGYASNLASQSSFTWGQAIGARALAESLGHHDLRVKSEMALLEMAKRGDGELEGIIDTEAIETRVREHVKLKQWLRECVPASANIDPNEFADLVLGSPSILIPNGFSQHVISTLNAGRQLDMAQAIKTFKDETDDLISLAGREAVDWLQNRLRQGLLTSTDDRVSMQSSIEAAPNAWASAALGEWSFASMPELAEHAYKKAVQQDPQHYEAWSQLAALLHKNGQHDDARVAYEKALALNESSAALCSNYASLLAVYFNQLKEAEKWFRRASIINPRDANIANNLGVSLWFQGGEQKGKEAILELKRAAELDLYNPKPWINIGYIYECVLKKYDDAETSYRKAISMTSKASKPRVKLAYLLMNIRRDIVQAEEQFRKAIADDETDELCLIGLAALLVEHKNQLVEGENAYQKALEINPKSDFAWAGLGTLQLNYLHQYKWAKTSFEKAAGLAPTEAAYQNALGIIEYDHLQNVTKAAEYFLKAIEINPSEDSARHNYAFLLRDAMGDIAGAKEVLKNLAHPEAWKDTQALHRALFAAHEDNWGQATEALKAALAEIKDSAFPKNSQDDWHRASAVLLELGFGPKLLEFLKAEGQDVCLMPWFAALEAHVVGDRQMLLNIPAEARDAAGILFDEIAKRKPLMKTHSK